MPLHSPRTAELAATHLILHPQEIAQCMAAKNWADLHALAAYLATDVPPAMAQTDPAMYRLLRAGVTTVQIMGYGQLSPAALAQLAQPKS